VIELVKAPGTKRPAIWRREGSQRNAKGRRAPREEGETNGLSSSVGSELEDGTLSVRAGRDDNHVGGVLDGGCRGKGSKRVSPRLAIPISAEVDMHHSPMIRAAKTIFYQVLPTLMRLTPCKARRRGRVSSLLDACRDLRTATTHISATLPDVGDHLLLDVLRSERCTERANQLQFRYRASLPGLRVRATDPMCD
jgi:hypothetical protein